MTSEFKYLDPEVKELIKEHIKRREQMAANIAQPEAPGNAAPAGMPGVEGAQAPMMGGGPDMATILGS